MLDPTTKNTSEMWPLDKLKNWSKNPRSINDKDFERLKKQIQKLGVYKPLLVTPDGTVLGGNMRLRALKDLKQPQAWVSVVNPANEAEMLEYALSDNDRHGSYNRDQLAELITLMPIELDLYKADLGRVTPLKELISEYGPDSKKLFEQFIVPPFSVLDTRQGYWQERREAWLELGIQSELGRPDVQKTLGSANETRGRSMPLSSVFDPVLTELIYKWFNVPNGAILDPFAGGSVRGIVAHHLDQNYCGIELRAEQVEANKQQAKHILKGKSQPAWLVGDSADLHKLLPKTFKADLIFSCPPYADLEVYSKEPGDLSNMAYDKFLEAYRHIISNAMSRLKDNRFAVFVVSEVRDKKTGIYRNLVLETVNAFLRADGNFYNEAILVNTPGSVPVRAAKQFNGSRKLGRLHQNVLIFYKGNPKKIGDHYPKLDAKLIDE